MSRYRTVDVRLWSDRRFLALTDDGRLLWLFLLTTPARLAVPGVIVGGEAMLAEQLGWEVERYRKGYQELLTKGLKVRSEGRVMWLANALKYQKIAGPKAMAGMAKVWDDIPECELKGVIWEELKIACKPWSILFTKLFPKVHGEGYAQLHMEGLSPGTGTGPRTGTGDRRAGRAAAPPPVAKDPPVHQPAIAEFDARYRAAYQTKPTWGDKQAAQIIRLVTAHGVDEVRRRIGILFDSPPSFLTGPHDVGTLVQHFDKLSQPGSRERPGGGRAFHDDVLDAQLERVRMLREEEKREIDQTVEASA